jgi:hypothetical protein
MSDADVSEEWIAEGAHILSEMLDDEAPLHERRYRAPAEYFIKKFRDRLKAEGRKEAYREVLAIGAPVADVDGSLSYMMRHVHNLLDALYPQAKETK